MSYFGDYQRKAIQSGVVDQEGDYQVKITEVGEGTLNDPKTGTKKYVQVKCLVNHANRPTVSIFLTEGDSFDGNYTAFCDTFGINPQGDPNAWIGRTGWIHINLKKKDGFTNMVPRWLLGEDGFVRREVAAASLGNSQGPMLRGQPVMQQPQQATLEDQFGDIPF